MIVDTIKEVLLSELERFARSYIKDHIYIKSRAISLSYIESYHKLPLFRNERDKLIKTLNFKLGRVMRNLLREGIIEKFNSKTYKRLI